MEFNPGISLSISAFDLDHTLITVNSSFKFGSYLKSQNLVPSSALSIPMICYAGHILGLCSIENLHQTAFEYIFKNRSKELIQHWAEAFVENFFGHICYKPAIECVEKARAARHELYILSSSPSFLVAPIAKRLGIANWLATEYAVDAQGQYSHISQLILGNDKAAYLEKLRKDISSRIITAYSDSHHDLPFLLAAERAVGVNPNRALRKECLRRNWPII